MVASVASASESLQFDYANAVLFVCPQKHIARLQQAQHALVTLMTQQFPRSSSVITDTAA